MAVYVVGDFIRETRRRKGYSQEEVSDSICTPASLSRIENGVQMPGRVILEKLLERLGTENSMFNMFVSREEMEVYEAVQTMTRNITDGNLTELERQIDKVDKLTEHASELERQFLIFAKGELLKQKDDNDAAAMELFMKAIRITLPKFDGMTPLKSNLLTFDEITIINSIAVLHAKHGEMKVALQLGFWLKEYMEEKVVDGKMKTVKYPMILYNLTNWLTTEKRFKEALEIALEGVDFCIERGNLPALPLLVLNKAYALAELEDYDRAKKCFQQAIIIFQTMKNYDSAQIVIDWCRDHYQMVF